jgi:hypothetical protein
VAGEELTKEIKKDGHENSHLVATIVVILGIKGVEMSEDLKKGVLTCFIITLPIIVIIHS